MKTKKSGIYAALTAAVLILIAILVTACLEPITGFKPPEKAAFPQIPENFVPTPGKGVVQFVIADEIKGRMIKPDVTAAADFAEFDLYIYVDNSGSPGNQYYDANEVPSQPIRLQSTTKPLELLGGSYFFKLDAYDYDKTTSVPRPGECCSACDNITDTANGCICVCCPADECSACTFSTSGIIAATGISLITPITINTSNTVTIELEAVGVSGTGEGRLEYSFNTGTLTTANFSVTSLTGGAGNITSTSLLPASKTGGEMLPADYYRITVQMAQSGHLSAYYTETIYIYEGMLTTADITLPALKNSLYDILFSFGDGRTPNTVTVQDVEHGTAYGPVGSTGTFLNTHGTYENPTHSTPGSNMNFAGWFLTTAAAAAPASNPTLKIGNSYVFIKDNLNLYAGWIAGTSLNFSITLKTIDGNAPAVNANTNYTQDQGTGSITFTVDDDHLYNNYSWTTSYDVSIPNTTHILTLTIDNTSTGVKYKAVGTYEVIMRAIEISTTNPVEVVTAVTVTAE